MAQVVIPYAPRPYQSRLHAQLETHRWNVIVCHRRFGKTVMAVNRLIKAALSSTKKDARYAYLAPTYAQGKATTWDYLKKYSAPIPGHKVNETELRIDYPNGSRIRIYGCDNPDSLRGLYLDGAVLDEYAMMSPRVFSEVIRPALADRGGWADFIGTPQGENHFSEIFRQAQTTGGEWFAAIYKNSETKIISDNEVKGLKESMSEEEFNQEFECSFEGSIHGAYYAKQLQQADTDGRIGNVPHETSLKVSTWWDLGVKDSTVLWFTQAVGKEIRVIDFYEASGEGLPHYAKILQSKPYIYDNHHAPHDIEVRELGTGRSRIEIARSLGIAFRVVPNISIEDGIEAGRSLLGRCWFDANKCKDGLSALRNYRKVYDAKREVFASRPLHDWSSHAADAFRYLAVGFKDAQPKLKKIEYREMFVA